MRSILEQQQQTRSGFLEQERYKAVQAHQINFGLTKSELGAVSPILRILKGFRMIVDNFSDYRDKKDRTNNPYQTQFTYTNQQGAREHTANYL